MGFLGILEDHKLAHVPATVFLEEKSDHLPVATQNLKHGTGKSSHIVLVPQPSDDPNDPLNWSQIKKIIAISIIFLGGCLFASVISGLLNAGLFVIAAELQVPIGKLVLISGYQLLVAGSTGALTAAASRKWGKRPVFLISSMLGFIGSIIGSASTSYQGLLAARIVQGGSTAAYESIMISMVGDIFFVHERGIYMSMVQFALGGVSMFANLITGPITTNLGWKWCFHLCVLFTGLQTVLVFFFVPETQFNRSRLLNTDEIIEDGLDVLNKNPQTQAQSDHVEESKDTGVTASVVTTRATTPIARNTYWQQLALFSGTYSDENMLQLLLAPFASCTNLVVLWVVVISGTITATYVAQAIVVAQIFSPPPYLLTPTGVGNLFIGPFIGCIVATALVGGLNDAVIKWCARKNRGWYEPEYRLVLSIFGLTTGAGLMGWGVVCEQYGSVYLAATLHGVTLFGITVVNITICSYGLDAYREMSSDIFVAAIIFKNFLFYGFTWFVNDWLAATGPAHVFYVFGALAFALLATTPLVFVFGKKYRSVWARHNIMEKLHIKPHAEQ